MEEVFFLNIYLLLFDIGCYSLRESVVQRAKSSYGSCLTYQIYILTLTMMMLVHFRVYVCLHSTPDDACMVL